MTDSTADNRATPTPGVAYWMYLSGANPLCATFTANTRGLSNADLMMGQHRRRRPYNK